MRASKGGRVQELQIGSNRAGRSPVLGWWARKLIEPLVSDGDPTVRADFDRCAHTPDVRSPGTPGCRAQYAALFSLRRLECYVGRAAQFAMHFVCIAVAAQLGQECIGTFGSRDGFGREKGGQTAPPIVVLAFDFALGLGRAGVTQRDAIEVERGDEVGERFGMLGEEQAVTVHIRFERQAVLAEGGGQKK